MRTDEPRFHNRSTKNEHSAFTLTELLVIVAIIALFVILQLPALARATNQTKRAQCVANLKQFTLAMLIYGNENNDRLPYSGGYWATDAASAIGSFVESTGCKWTVMYCPGTAPRFTDEDNFERYNWSSNFRALGYANTFPGSHSVLSSNQNATLTPQPIQLGFGRFTIPLASERVLLADATMSVPGGNTDKSLVTTWTDIRGGTRLSYTSPHLNGPVPSGCNVGMLDGHVEWREFAEIQGRTSGTFSPEFWW